MQLRHPRIACLVLAGGALLLTLLPAHDSGLQAQNATKPAVEKTANEKTAKSAEPDPRAADRAAIHKTTQGFTDAFQKGDAAAAAAYMTSGAELVPSDADPIRGRDAIQKTYAAHFAKNPSPKISIEPHSLDFPSRDTAIEDGVMTITTAADDGESHKIEYQILYVREDGKWYLASVREWHIEKTGLEDLAWLIGTWAAKQPQAEIHTTYEWFGNKSFIIGRFSVREKDTTVTGMQVIGTDPTTGELRTWTFEFDGGFGEGTCVRDGKQWIFETETALTDTRVMAASNILVRVDKNTFTWQPVNLMIDGEQISDLPPVKVVRVEAKK